MEDSVLRPLNSDPLTELELQGLNSKEKSSDMIKDSFFKHFYVKAAHFSRLSAMNLYPKLLTILLPKGQ